MIQSVGSHLKLGPRQPYSPVANFPERVLGSQVRAHPSVFRWILKGRPERKKLPPIRVPSVCACCSPGNPNTSLLPKRPACRSKRAPVRSASACPIRAPCTALRQFQTAPLVVEFHAELRTPADGALRVPPLRLGLIGPASQDHPKPWKIPPLQCQTRDTDRRASLNNGRGRRRYVGKAFRQLNNVRVSHARKKGGHLADRLWPRASVAQTST